jgi:nucleoside-diphosphate-sugar epimerase
MSAFSPVYLLFGKTGWIGGKLIELLKEQGKTLHVAESRTYDRDAVLKEIELYKPTHILNAAGVTGTSVSHTLMTECDVMLLMWLQEDRTLIGARITRSRLSVLT